MITPCGAWKGWKAFSTVGFTDQTPAVTVLGDYMYLIAKGTNDNQIYMTYTKDRVNWSSWGQLDPQHPVQAYSAPAVVGMYTPDLQPSYFFVFIKDADNHLLFDRWSYVDGAWSGWTYLGDTDVPASAVLTLSGPLGQQTSTIFVSARSPYDHTIWTNQTTDGATWKGWNQITSSPLPSGAPVTYAPPSLVSFGDLPIYMIANFFGYFEEIGHSPDGVNWTYDSMSLDTPNDTAEGIAWEAEPCQFSAP
jgi:hypothetical protein